MTDVELLYKSSIQPFIENVYDPFLFDYGVELSVVRLDKIHPVVNGNKWFKLKLNLQAAISSGHKRVLSFGGAYSNHLYALAAATSELGLQSIGVVRGEVTSPLNPVLQFAKQRGMLLVPVSRSDYRQKSAPEFVESLHKKFGKFYSIPEGGSNDLGVRGCEEIIDSLLPSLTSALNSPRCYVGVACGTGATLAGLIRGSKRLALNVNLLGIAVLKGAEFLNRDITSWIPECESGGDLGYWRVVTDYHCGGYAKQSTGLKEFLAEFQRRADIPLEPVYTGKLFFGLYDLVKKGAIPSGSQIYALHTGGIY